jgi:hypothetical protein
LRPATLDPSLKNAMPPELSNEALHADLKHLNSLALAGQNIQCELRSMSAEEQLQLARAAMKPEFKGDTTALRVRVDGSDGQMDEYLTAKEPSTQACALPTAEVVKPLPAPTAHADLNLPKFAGWHVDPQAKAAEISQLIKGDLDGDEDAKGWLRKKLCDLKSDYPPDREKVLAILQKDGAEINRDANNNPVSIKFKSGFFFPAYDTIDLTADFSTMTKNARDQFNQNGVGGAMQLVDTAPAAYWHQVDLENGTLPEAKKKWFEKSEKYQ